MELFIMIALLVIFSYQIYKFVSAKDVDPIKEKPDVLPVGSGPRLKPPFVPSSPYDDSYDDI